MHEPVKLRGFFRLQIDEDGDVVGDSGWIENTVTNDGKRLYLARTLGALAGSEQVSHAALGTGTEPGAAATTLEGEITDDAASRVSLTAATSGSTSVQFTGTFDSTNSFVTANKTIRNVGLFQQSNTNTATIFAGNTYATSQVQTNQNVNLTYRITFT